VGDQQLDRRAFLRLAGTGAVYAAAGGFGCGSGSEQPGAAPVTSSSGPRGGKHILRTSAEDAAKAAEGRMRPIFDKWRDRGPI
jgi:hypothetical protein